MTASSVPQMQQTHNIHQPHQTSAMPRQARSVTDSVFVLSAAIFALINLALVAAQPLEPLPVERIPTRPTWESHRTRDFMKGTAPQVVLFGSSLMMIPTACRDADFLNVAIDPVVHPYSRYMQALIAEKSGAQLECFNFALPGGMISDHYMVTSALFNKAHKPRLAVFGISLRDFIDSGVECAAATPAYHYFSRYKSEAELEQLLPLSMPAATNRGEYLADKYIYLYGKRINMQVRVNDSLKEAGSAILAAYPEKKLEEDGSAKANNNPDAALSGAEVTEGMVALLPQAFYPWQDNSREYKNRFKGRNQAMFEVQKKYFDMLLTRLQKDDVQILLVNMPLTQANMALMPEGFYREYLGVLAGAKAKYHCAVLDLNDQKSFALNNFKDPVHMNGSGGKVLIDRIVAAMSTLPAAAGKGTILEAIAGSTKSGRSTASRIDIAHF